MRVGTFESGMFDTMKKNEHVRKGDFLMLFNNRKRMLKYLACIAIGLPVWYCIGILIKFSEGFATTIGVVGPKPDAAFSIMYAYIGLSVGDLISGILSQIFRSRKKIVFVYFVATSLITVLFLTWHGMSTTLFYFMCFAIGTATGYWALFVTMAAEQFGTNIRATVASTTPNFVRGAVIPIVLSFKALEVSMGNIASALIIGGICMTISLLSLWYLKESFGKDLDYAEVS
jgi:MFS transporter, putative metabolite:H+ symporter